MQRISTSATLLLKFFIPTFWVSFFGSVTVAILLAQSDYYGRVSITTVRAIALAVFVLGCLLWWKSVLQLKRMEADEDYLYISNYFKTFRYSYSSIESLKITDYKFFKKLDVKLKAPGTFGDKPVCIISEKLFSDFMFENPKIAFQFGFKPPED